MAQKSPDPAKPVNVEDLLRLKRSERPKDEFWNQFDRELHQRMLQTLVKKDPWYLQITRVFSGSFTQTVGVGGFALLVAMLVLRPTQVERSAPEAGLVSRGPAGPVVNSSMGADFARSDYQIESISTHSSAADESFKRDFKMEGIQVAADAPDYSINFSLSSSSFGPTEVVGMAF